MKNEIQDKWKFKFFNLIFLVVFISISIMYGWKIGKYVLGSYFLSLIVFSIVLFINMERKRVELKYENGKKRKIEYSNLFNVISKITPIVTSALFWWFFVSIINTPKLSKELFFLKCINSGYVFILLLISIVLSILFYKFDKDEVYWSIMFVSITVGVPTIFISVLYIITNIKF